ncbi:hypothetical protein GYMLUDRAFT_239460 [Collybiopsis luxurians FD-317 M1]|nr:hypothetical protein GYMLUDRAFT_239460 [Collybiopsis luxurians FD-317 M1]
MPGTNREVIWGGDVQMATSQLVPLPQQMATIGSSGYGSAPVAAAYNSVQPGVSIGSLGSPGDRIQFALLCAMWIWVGVVVSLRGMEAVVGMGMGAGVRIILELARRLQMLQFKEGKRDREREWRKDVYREREDWQRDDRMRKKVKEDRYRERERERERDGVKKNPFAIGNMLRDES